MIVRVMASHSVVAIAGITELILYGPRELNNLMLLL